MQNVYYIDNSFSQKNSTQYILSIRYSTDGFSFCVHDSNNRLLVFSHRPNHSLSEAMTDGIIRAVTDEPLLNLKYKKVFVLTCQKEKMLVPAHAFSKSTAADIYRLCLELRKDDTIVYRKIQATNSYLIEAVPCDLVSFLSSRYASLCIIDSAYPFIVYSLSGMLFNADYLFIDIHDGYFDLLIAQNNNDVLLFNSFSYGSVNDIIYHALNCLQQCNIDAHNLQTTVSGNLVNEPIAVESINRYIPNIAILNYTPLSQMVKDDNLNNSSFIHLLNIHKCE